MGNEKDDELLKKRIKEAEASYNLLNNNKDINFIRPTRFNPETEDHNFIKPRTKSFSDVNNIEEKTNSKLDKSELKKLNGKTTINNSTKKTNTPRLFNSVEKEEQFIKKLDETNQQFKIREKEKIAVEKKVIKKIEKKLYNLDKQFSTKIQKLNKKEKDIDYEEKTIQIKNEFKKAWIELEEDVNYIANTVILDNNIDKDKIKESYQGYNFSSRVANFMNMRSKDISNVKNKTKNKY